METRRAVISYLWDACGAALLKGELDVVNCLLVLISGLRRLDDAELARMLDGAYRDPALDPGPDDPR